MFDCQFVARNQFLQMRSGDIQPDDRSKIGDAEFILAKQPVERVTAPHSQLQALINGFQLQRRMKGGCSFAGRLQGRRVRAA